MNFLSTVSILKFKSLAELRCSAAFGEQIVNDRQSSFLRFGIWTRGFLFVGVGFTTNTMKEII